MPHLGMTYGMASITATVVIQIISAPRKAGGDQAVTSASITLVTATKRLMTY